jgi:hypothetical protein
MKRFASIALLAALAALSAAACRDPITVANIQGCIRKNCGESEAVGYQQCEAACRQKYGQ